MSFVSEGVGLLAEVVEGGGVLRISIDRPKGNVLTRDLLAALRACLDAEAASPGLRLVLLEGLGGHFSFGLALPDLRPAEARATLAEQHALLRAMASFPLPIAVVVRGRCLGAGLEIALAASFVLASDQAFFAAPAVRFAHASPALEVLAPLRLGGLLAERLLLTGEELPAPVAQLLGLVTSLFREQDDAREAALGFYRERLGQLSPAALRYMTQALRGPLRTALGAPLDVAEARYLDERVPSADAIEGIAAFLEGRSPRW